MKNSTRMAILSDQQRVKLFMLKRWLLKSNRLVKVCEGQGSILLRLPLDTTKG